VNKLATEIADVLALERSDGQTSTGRISRRTYDR
jgi:hypothetical protein